MRFKPWHNKDEVLVLRTCKPDMSSPSSRANGFKWPKRGRVKAPDWDPSPECGHGLHGLLWGEGHCRAMYTKPDAVWLVVATEGPVVDLGQKCKFPEGRVVHWGDKRSATQFLYRYAPHKAIYGLTLTAGDDVTLTAGAYSTLTAGRYSTLTAGRYSTLTAGHRSTLTTGHRSTLTAGADSTLTSGHRSTLTAGAYSTLTSGHCSTLIAGHRSTLTAGDYSTLNAGDYSTLIAGDYSTLNAGDYSTLIAGHRSTLTAGEGSYLIAGFFDGLRCRRVMAQVGENGIKPDTPYKVNVQGQFVKAPFLCD